MKSSYVDLWERSELSSGVWGGTPAEVEFAAYLVANVSIIFLRINKFSAV